LRASGAGITSSKKIQICAPLPERERSIAAGNVEVPACFQKGRYVLAPPCLVEIDAEEKAGLVKEHRINAHDEVFAITVFAAEVPPDRFNPSRQEIADAGQSLHLILGFSQIPRTHSLPQAG